MWKELTFHSHDNVLPAFAGLEQSIANPQDARTAFEIGHRSDVGFYDWIETRPIQAKAFAGFMQAQFSSLPSWLSVLDFDSEISKDAEPSTFVFVDVGGGTGQQCQALCDKFPNMEGKVVLQDRPEVLKKAITGSCVDRMPYDYLTQQPVKGSS
jgi:demethylsterigmatocystin 6-O-methyltransferase